MKHNLNRIATEDTMIDRTQSAVSNSELSKLPYKSKKFKTPKDSIPLSVVLKGGIFEPVKAEDILTKPQK